MRAKFFVILTAASLVVPVGVLAQTTDRNAESLKALLSGMWLLGHTDPKDCWCGNCLRIDFERDDESFCIEVNQIFVQAYYRLHPSKKAVQLFFRWPTDLGRGGVRLPWKSFDPRQPLAVIDLSKLNQGELSVRWRGFRNIAKPTELYPYGENYGGAYYKSTDQHR